MTSDDNRPGALVFVAGVSGMVFISSIGLMNDRPEFDRVYWSVIYSAFAFFFSLCWLAWPAIVTYRHGHLTEQAKMRHDREMLGQPPTMNNDPVIVDNQPKADGLTDRWIAYWIAFLVCAEAKGGVSYQRTKDFFAGDNATWRECAIIPFIKQGYVNAIVPRVETTCAGDWTPERIRWRLEGRVGIPPTPPHEPPEPYKQQATRETNGIRP